MVVGPASRLSCGESQTDGVADSCPLGVASVGDFSLFHCCNASFLSMCSYVLYYCRLVPVFFSSSTSSLQSPEFQFFRFRFFSQECGMCRSIVCQLAEQLLLSFCLSFESLSKSSKMRQLHCSLSLNLEKEWELEQDHLSCWAFSILSFALTLGENRSPFLL